MKINITLRMIAMILSLVIAISVFGCADRSVNILDEPLGADFSKNNKDTSRGDGTSELPDNTEDTDVSDNTEDSDSSDTPNIPSEPVKPDSPPAALYTDSLPLSRAAASEGMVLLKNEDSVLPLKSNDRVAIIGNGVNGLIGGGGGSGSMPVTTVRFLEGMKTKHSEDKLKLNSELAVAYSKDKDYSPSQEELKHAVETSDKVIYTITRNSGEGSDRSEKEGDYYLSRDEIVTLKNLVDFGAEEIIVVLNVGSVIDTTRLLVYPQVKAILLAWYPGQYGGLAISDVLVGDVNPSGKLVDTFAKSYDDYPSAENFLQSNDYVEYTEDIFVGYRYFETFDPEYKNVNFEFGFGLSYTEFEYSNETFDIVDDKIEASVTVTNVGNTVGMESVQLYFAAPQGALGKPAKQLCGFAKTYGLAPGGSQTLRMSVDIADLASYDDTGKIKKSAYVLEAGEYDLFIGSSIKNVDLLGTYNIDETIIVEELTEQLPATLIEKRLLADGSYENISKEYTIEALAPRSDRVCADAPEEKIYFDALYESPELMDSFLAQLTPEELIRLCYGQPALVSGGTGAIGDYIEYRIPRLETADGPAGLRLSDAGTAFPVGTLLACSWSTELLGKIGAEIAKEAKERGIDVWLAPALNIHRNVLCGRNFEYYSEDPYLTGILASAITDAVQKGGVAVCIKHFVGNEKEVNRNSSDSRMSERALREIYLRPFELAIEKADPWMVMSSYNLVNGVETAESYSLLTEILRNEWGYKGVVCTDWNNNTELYRELLAGNDIKMPTANLQNTLSAYQAGRITREVLEDHAARILELMLKLNKTYSNINVIEILADTPTTFRSVDYSYTNGGGKEDCEDVNGTMNTTYNDAGRDIYYTIDVKRAGTYRLNIRIASPEGKGAFEIYIDDALTASFHNRENTGGWQIWKESSEVLTFTLLEGEHILKLHFIESGINFNTLTFTPLD